MPKGSFDLKAWARVGAEKRLEQIKAELEAIYKTFPELRVGTRRPGRPRHAVQNGAAAANAEPRRRKKRLMSAEARAKIAAAQRRRWAKVQRAKKAS